MKRSPLQTRTMPPFTKISDPRTEANAEIRKRIAANPGEGFVLAGKEFTRLTVLVSKSLFSLVSNFQARGAFHRSIRTNTFLISPSSSGFTTRRL